MHCFYFLQIFLTCRDKTYMRCHVCGFIIQPNFNSKGSSQTHCIPYTKHLMPVLYTRQQKLITGHCNVRVVYRLLEVASSKIHNTLILSLSETLLYTNQLCFEVPCPAWSSVLFSCQPIAGRWSYCCSHFLVHTALHRIDADTIKLFGRSNSEDTLFILIL